MIQVLIDIALETLQRIYLILATSYGLYSPEFECPEGEISATVQNSPGTHPASCVVDTATLSLG